MNLKKNAVKYRIVLSSLFFAATLLAFSGFAAIFCVIFKFQAVPLLMRCGGAATAGAVLMSLLLVTVTLLFGRFYCSLLCPFGILQDIFIFALHRKSTPQNNRFLLRYLIAGIVLGLFAGGSNAGFLLLAPYSNSGRIFASFSLGGLIVLLLMFALTVWKKRFFCTSLCPVGTVLGAISAHSVLRLQISDECIQCGKCAKTCPAGCIDIEQKHIDNERCIRCMTCLKECPKECISFKATKPEKLSVSGRRQFLISAGAILAGTAAGLAFAKSGISLVRRKLQILPPGAGNARKFSKKCTACMLCVANCPEDIIVPSPGGTAIIELDLSRGSCNYNCNRCGTICPTGAISPLALVLKRRVKIAEANFDPRNCIVFQDGKKCGKCGEACPTGAISLRKNGTPRPIKKNLCIGCGACQKVCPAQLKAMTVSPIEKQIILQPQGEEEK